MNSPSDAGSVLILSDFASVASGVLPPARTSTAFLAWCPTVDMLALSYAPPDQHAAPTQADDNTAHSGLVFCRLSGQLVWASTPTSPAALNPLAIAWSETGRMFAVALRDGACRVYSSNTGKPLFTVLHDGVWSAVAWGTHRFSDAVLTASATPYKDLIGTSASPFKHMPKLSLSPHQLHNPQAMYTSRSVLEDIIHAKYLYNISAFEMSVVLCGSSSNGLLSVSLFGTFNLGTVSLAEASAITAIVPFSEFPQLSMAVATENGAQKLYSVDLDFFNKYGVYLADVTLVPTQILALLEYVRSEVASIQSEIKAMVAAQQSFYKDLAPPDHDDPTELIVVLLMDALLTGVARDSVPKWISQHVKEKGLKRWRKDCLHAYESIRRRLFVHIMPACERLLLSLSHLRGLARWTERGKPLNLDPELLDTAVTQVSAAMREVNMYLWEMNGEFLLFRAYSNWVDILYEEVTKTPLRENPGEGPRVAQTVKVAEYITKHVPLATTIPSFGKETTAQEGDQSLEKMVADVTDTCSQVFDKIKKTMLEKVKVSPARVLSTDPATVVRLRTAIETSNSSQPPDYYCYIAMYSEETNPCEVIVARTRVDTSGGTGKLDHVEVCRVDMSLEGAMHKVDQVEFVDDEDLMLLISTRVTRREHEKEKDDEEEVKAVLVSMSYCDLLYTVVPVEDGNKAKSLQELVLDMVDTAVPMTIKKSREFPRVFDGQVSRPSTSGSTQTRVFNEFEDAEDDDKRVQMIEHRFVPIRFAINGARRRRVGCLLEQDRRRYIFFDIDGEEYEEVEEENPQPSFPDDDDEDQMEDDENKENL